MLRDSSAGSDVIYTKSGLGPPHQGVRKVSGTAQQCHERATKVVYLRA